LENSTYATQPFTDTTVAAECRDHAEHERPYGEQADVQHRIRRGQRTGKAGERERRAGHQHDADARAIHALARCESRHQRAVRRGHSGQRCAGKGRNQQRNRDADRAARGKAQFETGPV
jgi:hypothetical protein